MNKISRPNLFWQKNILFIVALLFAFLVTWKIIDQANKNHELKQRADETRARIDLLAQKKKNQALDNEFFRSDYYLDLAIREQQGFLLADESVLIINPQNIIQLKEDYQPDIVAEEEPAEELSNVQQWKNFILDIDPSTN